MPAFTQLHDRSVPLSGSQEDGTPCLASCCPAMDLVAFANKSQLVVNRSIKWEPVFKSTCSVSCMAWRPDGKALAVGQEDGLIVLYDVEDGEEFSLPRAARPHKHPIVCMCWTKQESSQGLSMYKDRAAILTKTKPLQDLSNRDAGNSKTAFKSTASALMDMPLFGVENTPRNNLEVLLSGDSSGVVTIGAFGYFPIGCIDLSGAFDEDNLESPPRVCQLCLSGNLEMLMAILESKGVYRIVSVETKVLALHSNELRHLAAQCGHISEQIANAKSAIHAMAKHWSDGIQALQRNIEPLRHQLRCFERPNTAEQELFMMLTCGVTSTALQRYIEDLQEQSLQRLGKALDSTCAALEDVAGKTLLHAAQALVFRLHDILGLAQWKEKFEPIGLKENVINKLLENAQVLLLKVQETLSWVRDARANFAAFTIWLQTVWKKNQKTRLADGADAPRKLLAQVDSDRLVKLLSRDLLHPHIGEQFRSETLSPVTHDPVFQPVSIQTGISGVSLQLAFDKLQSGWMEAFHMTSECVSTSFRPVENRRIDGIHDRLVDMHFSDSSFYVAVGSKTRDITLFTKECTGKDKKTSPLVERSLVLGEEIHSVSDIRFYDGENMLVAFTNKDDQPCLGQVRYVGDDIDGELLRSRDLRPSTWKTTNLVCQGRRGIALVFTSNKRLRLFDVEEDEDEEED